MRWEEGVDMDAFAAWAVVAARRRGFPPAVGPPGVVVVVVVVVPMREEEDEKWGWRRGVLAPVASGVERLDGSSEVKIVADEGEMM